jgi:hypothetical protein
VCWRCGWPLAWTDRQALVFCTELARAGMTRGEWATMVASWRAA